MNGIAAVGAAFAAGLVSSATPCVIAAVPVAVGFVGGTALCIREAVTLSASFVSGMVLSFVLLGLAAARLGLFFGAAGDVWPVLVGIGLAGIGIWLWRTSNSCSVALPIRLQERLRGSGNLGASALGALTGTVMTPCATPALAAAVSLAGVGAAFGESMWFGALLLFAYSLGHSVLLFAAGVAPTQIQALTRRLDHVERWVPGRRTFAGLLVLAGFWIAFAGPVQATL